MAHNLFAMPLGAWPRSTLLSLPPQCAGTSARCNKRWGAHPAGKWMDVDVVSSPLPVLPSTTTIAKAEKVLDKVDLISGVVEANAAVTIYNKAQAVLGKFPEGLFSLPEDSRGVQIIDMIMGAMDNLTKVHPAARIAWGFISAAYDLFKGQAKLERNIIALYGTLDHLLKSLLLMYNAMHANSESRSQSDVPQALETTLQDLFEEMRSFTEWFERYIENLSATGFVGKDFLLLSQTRAVLAII
ncbi:uncharacterized protein EV422DRAFT_196578 [Fimicolochytrium jonesii]|uniref:uncharacterized protein n=1 Tax=Fimicolochytrium jonesii TaxID=1396493 RepID=UPI0022FDF2A4|nr:uncharacterized protein EV422DRAFT_196578 [Fimicolochytrium jonesii]KAI8818267.1 hypothetical protein EV422DRAFT_196578 [Fimicolochytrium jonesii]